MFTFSLLKESRHLREPTFTAGTTRDPKTCTGRGWWSLGSVTRAGTSLWRAAEWPSRLRYDIYSDFNTDLPSWSSMHVSHRCTWALVVAPGSSGRFPTTACQWTWSTTRGLSTSCFKCCPSTFSTGSGRVNSTPCTTTPCTPSSLHTGTGFGCWSALEKEGHIYMSLHKFVPFFCCLIRLFSKIPVINDDLPLKILSGSVIVKPNVKEINGSTVVFTDGTTAEKVRGLHFSNPALEATLRIISHCLVPGGHDCLCHGLRLWFSIPAEKQHAKVGPPSGSVQARFPSKSGASHAGRRGLHPRPRSHHAPSWDAGPLGHPCLQRWGWNIWIVSDHICWITCWITSPCPSVFSGLNKLPSNQTMIKAVERDTKDIENKSASSFALLHLPLTRFAKLNLNSK